MLHYGPVPRFRPDTWDLRVLGATESGQEHVEWLNSGTSLAPASWPTSTA